MKIETREVTVTKKVYIAEDGEEFFNESECEAHEMDLIASRIRMYDSDLDRTDDAGHCIYVKLATEGEVEEFKKLLDCYGYIRDGIEKPSIYLYIDEWSEWIDIKKVARAINNEGGAE